MELDYRYIVQFFFTRLDQEHFSTPVTVLPRDHFIAVLRHVREPQPTQPLPTEGHEP